MELSETYPPPTSTVLEAAEDQCSIDVPDVAMDGVTLFICLCGLLGNGAVLWLLGFRIRRNPITVYILNLAVADFTFLLFTVTLSLLYVIENISCYTVVPMSYKRAFLLLSEFSYNTGLYLLTAISIERSVSILCSSIRRPLRLSVVVCVLLWVLSVTVIAVVTSLCLLHEHEHCQMGLIFMYVLNFLIFAPPMVISNVMLFIKVLCGSKHRQPKRLYVVIFLAILFFLIFGVPLSVWSFMFQFRYTHVSIQMIFLLACINSSIKPFIYFLVGSCRRHCSLVSLQVAFRGVFEELEDSTACSSDTTMDTMVPAS